jgi:hypothetical protein
VLAALWVPSWTMPIRASRWFTELDRAAWLGGRP